MIVPGLLGSIIYCILAQYKNSVVQDVHDPWYYNAPTGMNGTVKLPPRFQPSTNVDYLNEFLVGNLPRLSGQCYVWSVYVVARL